jgi:hypothetical protein
VVRRQVRRHPLNHLKKRVIVRNENLDVIAELGDFGGRPDKVRDWPRRPVPNENVEPAFPQIVHDPLADDAQA